jgi:hypothetical protein
LTLAAMSLGFGVVQLDVTIVNTALNSIGTSLGGGVSGLQWVVSAYDYLCSVDLDRRSLGRSLGSQRNVHGRVCHVHGSFARLRVSANVDNLDRGAGGVALFGSLIGQTNDFISGVRIALLISALLPVSAAATTAIGRRTTNEGPHGDT